MSGFHPLTMFHAYAIEMTQDKEQWSGMPQPDSKFLPRSAQVTHSTIASMPYHADHVAIIHWLDGCGSQR